MGIHTEGPYQAIYVDTPGLHMEEKRAINRLMNRAASSSIGDVELVIFVVEGTHWTPDDEMVVNKLRDIKAPVLLAINKIDNVTDKSKLLPHPAVPQRTDELYRHRANVCENVLRRYIAASSVASAGSDYHFPEDILLTLHSAYGLKSFVKN